MGTNNTTNRALKWVLTCLFLMCLMTVVLYRAAFGPWIAVQLKVCVPPSPGCWDRTSYTRQHSSHMNTILLKELERYTEVIERVKISSDDVNRSRNTPRTLDAESETYFTQLKSVQNIRTVLFNLSRSTVMGLVNTKTYAVHSNDCKNFKSRGNLTLWSLKKLPCLEGVEYLYHHPSIEDTKHYDFQTGLYSSKEFASASQPQDNVTVGYLQVVKDAYISAKGDYSTAGTYNSLSRCYREDKIKHQNTKVPTYSKVFSIADLWGDNFYHVTVEGLPRIVLSLPFLLKHKDIKVHIMVNGSFQTSYLSSLGISADRIVVGDVKAKTAYIPNGSYCGHGQVMANNIESIFLRAGLGTEHVRDTIVLIKRSYSRRFDNHDSILKMVEEAAKMYNLRVEVFRDDPPPKFNVSKIMFNRAAAIVAPHGSGLANMILAQPGTCIIEGVCYHERLGINHCFVYLAQVLGHRHHGVVSSNHKDCGKMEPNELAPQVHQCLKHLLQVK